MAKRFRKHKPTVRDGAVALQDHLASVAATARERYGPRFDGAAIQRMLEDREIVRYPIAIVFDDQPLHPGEFAFAESRGCGPGEGFTLYVHPHFETGKKPVSTTGNGNTEPSVLIPGNLPKFVSPRMDLAQVREDAFILILNLRQLKKQSDMDRVIEESLSKIQNQEKKRRLSEDLKFMISRRKQIESNIISSLEKTEKLVGDRSIDSSIDGLEEDWKRLSQILIGKSKIPQSISDQLLSTQGEAKNIVYKLSKLSGSLRSLSSDADSYLEKTKIFNNNLNGSGKD